MALMNRKLQEHVQTVFLMSVLRWMYISSTNIKNVATLGGNVRGLVPDSVIPRLRKACSLPEDWPDSMNCECSPAFEDCSKAGRI
jgi:pantetheine-phosphate adenylyltransferase